MRVFLGVALALALSAGAARAANYAMAGCGLGALVIKENNMAQILAATLNGLVGNQTFGITSGSLNCVKDGAVASNREAEGFAEANYAALMRQVAAGHGEHLASFASLAGCQPQPAVMARAQVLGTAIFISEKTTAEEVVQNFRAVMASDPSTAALCHD